ncbi:MAG TPA: hypothetical protein VK869_00585, partial [Rubrobacteraceae bacterium]|nr:hypothetical protein [Rubrobacteraceae bacterium]
MLLAAMLAMVLAAAAPAFAQAVGGDVDVQYVDCSQVQAAAAAQGQYGDADAGDVASAAAIAQELNITQEQVNACLEGVAAGGDITVEGDDGTAAAAASASAAAAAGAAAGGAAAGGSAAAAGGALPETGGASLLALGAGALLVAGGLLARRIVR